MNILYKTSATSTGGRDGRAVSADNKLEVKLAAPRELGGTGAEGTNPEQLFAAGYSACFLSAMKFVAGGTRRHCRPTRRSRRKSASARTTQAASEPTSNCAYRCRGSTRPMRKHWSKRRTTCARTRTRRVTTCRCA